MTTHDFDQPYMIYEGEPPPHLLRKAAQAEQQSADEGLEGFDWSSLLIIALVLAFGIVIGVCATLALRPPAPSSAPVAGTPVVAASAQLQDDAFASVRGPKAIAPPLTATPPRDRAASTALGAHAINTPPPKASVASRKARDLAAARPAGPCDAAPTHADRAICANAALAAADREMRRAYQRALDAGAPPMPLRASQENWLIASEVAADRSTLDLAASYARRIAELNALARPEPPH